MHPQPEAKDKKKAPPVINIGERESGDVMVRPRCVV